MTDEELQDEVQWVYEEWLPEHCDALAAGPAQPTHAGWTMFIFPPHTMRRSSMKPPDQ